MVAQMRIQGERKRGRLNKRWMDTVKDDMRDGASRMKMLTIEVDGIL